MKWWLMTLYGLSMHTITIKCMQPKPQVDIAVVNHYETAAMLYIITGGIKQNVTVPTDHTREVRVNLTDESARDAWSHWYSFRIEPTKIVFYSKFDEKVEYKGTFGIPGIGQKTSAITVGPWAMTFTRHQDFLKIELAA
jgi:hypothetical protein